NSSNRSSKRLSERRVLKIKFFFSAVTAKPRFPKRGFLWCALRLSAGPQGLQQHDHAILLPNFDVVAVKQGGCFELGLVIIGADQLGEATEMSIVVQFVSTIILRVPDFRSVNLEKVNGLGDLL